MPGKHLLTILAATALIATEAHAESDMNVGAHLGLLGPGLDLGIGIDEHFDARLGFNAYTYGRDGTEGGIDYDLDLKLRSLFAQVDWHPTGGGFFLAAGLYANGNELKGQAKAATSYTVGDTTYTASQVGTLRTRIDFNSAAPYLGLGWGGKVGSSDGLTLRLDLGVLYQGSPDVTLTADGTLASNAAFQADLKKEEQDLQNAIDNFKWYPLIQIGIAYAF